LVQFLRPSTASVMKGGVCVVGAIFERTIVHMDSTKRMTSTLGMIAVCLARCGLSRGALRGSRLEQSPLIVVVDSPLMAMVVIVSPW